MLREWLTTAAAAVCLTASRLAVAAADAVQASPKGKFGTSVDDLVFPSIGRVVLGFLVTVVLAVALAFLIRRVWPSMLGKRLSSGTIKPIERTAVSATLTVHLVEVDGIRITVAEGRSGVGVAVMPAPHPDSRSDARGAASTTGPIA